MDQECCARCVQRPDCEFWTRMTNGITCELKRSFIPSNRQVAGWRTGFGPKKEAPAEYCKAMKMVWRLAGDILRRTTFPTLGSAFANARVDLPSQLDCSKMTVDDSKLEVVLSNMTVAGSMTSTKTLGSNAADITLWLRASPSFSLDLNTCQSNRLRLSLWDIGLDIMSEGRSSTWLSKLTTSRMRASLRQSRWSGQFLAFPAQHLHGKVLTRFRSSAHFSEVERSRECCERCSETAVCEGFIQGELSWIPFSGPSCELHKFTEPKKLYHANFKEVPVTVDEDTYLYEWCGDGKNDGLG